MRALTGCSSREEQEDTLPGRVLIILYPGGRPPASSTLPGGASLREHTCILYDSSVATPAPSECPATETCVTPPSMLASSRVRSPPLHRATASDVKPACVLPGRAKAFAFALSPLLSLPAPK